MSDFTDYAEEQIRDWMSQGTDAATAPTNLHVALHTADPTDSPDGSNEVSATDYSRASTAAGSGWTTSSNPTGFSNANEVSFGEATSSWGTISHVSLWDSSTGGNCLAAFSVSSSKAIESGDEATFPAGDITFNID